MVYDYLRVTGTDREVQITVGNLRVRIKMKSANTEVWYSIEHSSKGSATCSITVKSQADLENIVFKTSQSCFFPVTEFCIKHPEITTEWNLRHEKVR